MRKINVLVIDDHSLFRETLAFMMSKDDRFQVIGETNDADIALATAKEGMPDVILMDINMSPVDGFELTRRMIAFSRHFKIIAISMHGVLGYARRILQAGAMGYVTKSSGISELFSAIQDVYNGKKYICQEIKDVFVEEELETLTSGLNSLSTREIYIAGLIKEGLSSKDIACQLALSPKTVEAHRHNILKKLNLKNTAALVNFTNIHGL